MSTDKSQDFIQLRSPEVQELIGHIPGGFMRYGIGLILFLLTIVLLTCNFIPYKETQNLQLRVLPNVSSQSIHAPFDGKITHCYVKEGTAVSVGDTLISMNANGQLHYLKATIRGKIKLRSFCAPNENIKKGETLLEICDYTHTSKVLIAIADTLPKSVSVEQLQTIELNIDGHVIPFKLNQIIEDKEKCKTRALFQAEKRINLAEQHQVESKITSNHGVLLDKLIQIDF